MNLTGGNHSQLARFVVTLTFCALLAGLSPCLIPAIGRRKWRRLFEIPY